MVRQARLFSRDFRGASMRKRPSGGFSALLLAIALAVSIGLFVRPSGRQVAGDVYVVDGDTLRMGETVLRLKGMDAPEMRQSCNREGASYPCGRAARDALINLVGSRKPQCWITGRDRYGRSLARCSVDGQDIGGAMVESGQAVAYGDYEREEARAHDARAGLWAGSFERPNLWRREHQP
jgi:endonuclease YncB( thermonuclease family)